MLPRRLAVCPPAAMPVAMPVGWSCVALLLGIFVPTPAPGQAPQDDCGACVRFELAVSENVYEVGAPIVLTIRLTNIGTEPVPITSSSDVTGRLDGYAFEVTDAAGERVPDPGARALALMSALGSMSSLSPGRTHERALTLNHFMAPLEPGQHFVTGLFSFRRAGQRFSVESDRLSFAVVPTAPARLRERVTELSEQMARDTDREIAALLGFTGDRSAIPHLVSLLYAVDGRTQVSAADALLYFDEEAVRDALFDAVRNRGPRDRMVELLVTPLQADRTAVKTALIPWLADTDAEARAAAVEGLSLANRPPDPTLFGALVGMLEDPAARIRHRAAAAVGVYQDAPALEALRGAVRDVDAGVRGQATIAVGWVADASPPDSATRRAAIDLLRDLALANDAASRQAADWLERLGGQ